MSDIFICATSFAAKTILYGINYIIKDKVDKVILLQENYMTDENFKFCNEVEIVFLEKLEECIAKSDMVLVLDNHKIPAQTIQIIKNETMKGGKKYYLLNDVWLLDSVTTDNQGYFDFHLPDTVPVVLHISLGCVAQSFCTEIALNRMLKENNICFGQKFTKETEKLLQQLSERKMLNDFLVEKLNRIDKKIDLYIFSINIGINLYSLIEYTELLKRLKADYIILQTGFDFSDYEAVGESIKFYTFSELDKIIKSRYVMSNKNHFVYCRKENEINPSVLDLESEKFEKDIFELIITGLSLPENILRII